LTAIALNCRFNYFVGLGVVGAVDFGWGIFDSFSGKIGFDLALKSGDMDCPGSTLPSSLKTGLDLARKSGVKGSPGTLSGLGSNHSLVSSLSTMGQFSRSQRWKSSGLLQ